MRLTRRASLALPVLLVPAAAAAAEAVALRGTGDLGLIIERANGSVLIVETTGRSVLARVDGLGDLSHATAVYAPDQRHAFVFGRDGGLTRIDMLEQRITRRVIQGGNAIGGAISDDGRLIAVSNYEPGGVKIFDHETLEPLYDIPAAYGDGKFSKTVGLVDLPGRRFMVSLYDSGEIWLIDCAGNGQPTVRNLGQAGELPYDGYVTADGRHYLAGLFGEDGLAHVDLWQDPPSIRRVMAGYGKGEEPLPVYKMPHLEGWGDTGRSLVLPAVGHHEVLIADNESFTETGSIAVHGQPVFCIVQPGGRYVWVNFAPPDNDTVQVIDMVTRSVVHEMRPGPGVLHMEFTPKGREVWMSVRDADKVQVYDTSTYTKLAELDAQKPSGIFFTARANRIGL
ncbi:MAG: protein nirF [Alphaproteobacteria bacterium]|nr:protein nirF [Alphaproteobacteria bacterium]